MEALLLLEKSEIFLAWETWYLTRRASGSKDLSLHMRDLTIPKSGLRPNVLHDCTIKGQIEILVVGLGSRVRANWLMLTLALNVSHRSITCLEWTEVSK